ncbi:MAG: amidohydrolase family protein [Candidatus Poribacteria bacterium]
MQNFIDCNCVIGRRSIRRTGDSSETEFYTLESLVDEMDYAGIGRALVYHSIAREYSPMFGNRKLMDEIRGNERFYPCWVVMPDSTDEMPNPEALVKEMKQSNVKCARMFPTEHLFSLSDWSCGNLLKELERNGIVLIIELDHIGWDGIDSLCGRYPKLPVIITNLNYRINRYLYPLLEKHKNLLIETSGYQVHSGIEDVCSRFGARRLIFGSRMPFWTPGPAVTLVEYSLISQKEKALIAGGNLSRLLRIKPSVKTKKIEKDESHINIYSLPLKDEIIIDAHTHMGPYFNFHIPDNNADGMIKVMDRLGIIMACTSPHIGITPDFKMGNDIAYEAMQEYRGRFFGYITINPNYPEEIPQELERCYNLGMRGIKIHPSLHGYPANGANLKPMWEFAQEKSLPVLSHTWAGDGTCSPTILGKLAEQYPLVPVILGHSGGTLSGYYESIEAAKKRENVFLETCCSSVIYGIIEMFVNKIGADRIIFGSDMPFVNANAQIGKILHAKISDDDKRKILGLNMAKLIFRLF